MNIDKKFIIEKRNVLNELRSKNLTLQELRILSIYLAKINPRDATTRVVRFPLEGFWKIMDISKVSPSVLRDTIDRLLCKTVAIPLGDYGAFMVVQLFKRAVIDRAWNGWYIEIDAHDDALPLMFDFKEKYFTYGLWNALRLKSSNQLRMYEILKQYEYIGERIISLNGLKELLGIDISEYSRYNNFRTGVLEVCKKALSENTDICFTYEVTDRSGRGGKVKYLKFTITKNDAYVDNLSLEEFLSKQELTDNVHIIDQPPPYELPEPEESYFEREVYPFLSDACKGEFSINEVQVLYNLTLKLVPLIDKSVDSYNLAAYNYLKRKYDELLWRAQNKVVKNRFGYLKKIIEADLELIKNPQLTN